MGKAGKKEHMKGVVKGFDVLEEAFFDRERFAG